MWYQFLINQKDFSGNRKDLKVQSITAYIKNVKVKGVIFRSFIMALKLKYFIIVNTSLGGKCTATYLYLYKKDKHTLKLSQIFYQENVLVSTE